MTHIQGPRVVPRHLVCVAEAISWMLYDYITALNYRSKPYCIGESDICGLLRRDTKLWLCGTMTYSGALVHPIEEEEEDIFSALPTLYTDIDYLTLSLPPPNGRQCDL